MIFIHHFTNQWLRRYRANISLIIWLNQLKRHNGKFTLKMYGEGESILLAVRVKGGWYVTKDDRTKSLHVFCAAVYHSYCDS